MPTLPLTERPAMALRVAGSRVSSVLSGVGRDQRPGVAAPSAATIPARTSGDRMAHAATRRARSVSGGALPHPAFGRDVGGTGPPVGPPVRPRPAPRLAPGAACAAPGAARSWESAYSSGDSISARGFDSPRLHSFLRFRVFSGAPGSCMPSGCSGRAGSPPAARAHAAAFPASRRSSISWVVVLVITPHAPGRASPPIYSGPMYHGTAARRDCPGVPTRVFIRGVILTFGTIP